MQLTDLRNAKTVDELARRIYNLPAGDKRIAAAAKAIAKANPHLAGDFGRLSRQTPVIVPTIAGLSAPPPSQSGVQMDRFIDLSNQIGAAAKRALAALHEGPSKTDYRSAGFTRLKSTSLPIEQTPKLNESVRKLHSQQFENLTKDIDRFQKLHRP